MYNGECHARQNEVHGTYEFEKALKERSQIRISSFGNFQRGKV
jgi:nucleoid DNA-binding protein